MIGARSNYCALAGEQRATVFFPEPISQTERDSVIGGVESENTIRHHGEFHRRRRDGHERNAASRDANEQLVALLNNIHCSGKRHAAPRYQRV